jgi:hypothetical protein
MSDIKLTDAEWRQFQAIPEQGYSHRAWIDARIGERVADVRKAALEDAATKLEEWAELWATQDGIEALMFAADDVAVVLIVEKLILAQAAAIRAAALGDAPTTKEN